MALRLTTVNASDLQQPVVAAEDMGSRTLRPLPLDTDTRPCGPLRSKAASTQQMYNIIT